MTPRDKPTSDPLPVIRFLRKNAEAIVLVCVALSLVLAGLLYHFVRASA
jgi:hypothetical protein